MKKIFLTIIYSLFFVCLFAQENKDIQARITLRDGSIYNGSITIKSIDLQTDYGKLSIPIKNVSSVDVGLTPNRTNKVKLENLAAQLSNDNEETRKIAYDELLKIKPSEIYVLMDYLYSDKYAAPIDGTYGLDQLVSELNSTFNLTNNVGEKDVISIDGEYVMGGLFTFPSIEIKTEFGSLAIPKDKMSKIEITYVPSDGSTNSKVINLVATKYISGNTNGGWYRTGINVKKGQRVSITANGEITLASLSNGKYTPKGAVGAAEVVTEGNAYPTYGQLVYKVGETGAMLTAGSKFNGTMLESGMLFISIYETVYNAANTGSYNVTIKLN